MTLQTAITNINTVLASISGIDASRDYLPDSLPELDVVALIYPGITAFDISAGRMKELGSIVIELHTPRGADLEESIKRVTPYYEAIPNAILDELQDNQLSGAVSTFGKIDCTGLVAMSYNGIETIGFKYTITDVKIETTIT